MSYKTSVYKSFSDIDQDEYLRFFKTTRASVFYHPCFLLAAELAPLLPMLASYYIVVCKEGKMVGFTPVYLQTSVDPFNVLSDASSHTIYSNTKALLTHIMHCSISEYLILGEDITIIEEIESTLNSFAIEIGAEFYGLINIQDERLLSQIDKLGYTKYFMWNKFYRDISDVECLDDFYKLTPRNGRKQYKKHLRKFNSNIHASIKIEKAELLAQSELKHIATLCHNTSAKYGTGDYYPVDKLTQFMSVCAEIITFISVFVNNKRISSNICFVYGNTLYMWACGMTYEDADFSPYLITVLKAFEYAKSLNLNTLDIGRTSQAMKERMGFVAKPLYFILNKTSAVSI